MALGRREALALGGVALAAAAAGVYFGPRLGAPTGGGPLAAARFTDLEGKARSITEWRGRGLVVNFWATWCAPCREEIPMLMEARSRHASNGIEVVGIAIDHADKVREYANSMKIAYPLLLADAGAADLLRSLGNSSGGLPFTVFVDRAGNPIRVKLGLLKAAELESVLQELAAAKG